MHGGQEVAGVRNRSRIGCLSVLYLLYVNVEHLPSGTGNTCL